MTLAAAWSASIASARPAWSSAPRTLTACTVRYSLADRAFGKPRRHSFHSDLFVWLSSARIWHDSSTTDVAFCQHPCCPRIPMGSDMQQELAADALMRESAREDRECFLAWSRAAASARGHREPGLVREPKKKCLFPPRKNWSNQKMFTASSEFFRIA